MKRKGSFALIFSLLLIFGMLSGCAADYSSEASDSLSTNETYSRPYDSTADTMPDGEYGYAESPTLSSTSRPAPENAKLIYTAEVELETTEFDSAVSGLNELTNDMGGYFHDSYVNNYGSYRSGTYTIRVPAGQFDEFCSAVGELCQLNSISRCAQDISEEYYDSQSRLLTQQTKLARLQELLSRAESMEDIITIESAISETELQIEYLTGTLNKYDSLVNFSTVTIYLQEVYKLSDVDVPAIGFGARLSQALKNGCSSFVSGLERSVLSFARAWVEWLIAIIVVLAAVLVIKKLYKNRRLKRAEYISHKNDPASSPIDKDPKN